MERELKDAFAQAGLVHLLSISGFHIGVIATWVVFLLRRVGVRLPLALVTAAVIATAYVAFLRWPAPAVRAAALAWALAWLRWRQRAAVPDALLGTTALAVLLLDPWSVFDLGAWLSVLSLWGAVRVARWVRQAGGVHWAWQSAAASVGAMVATAPLTAAALGAVAPIGILLNVAAVPLAAVAVPGVLASLLLDPILPAVAQAVAAGSGLTLHALELIAVWGARVPLGHVVTDPVLRAAVPWSVLLATVVWATPRTGQLRLAAGRVLLATTCATWLTLVAVHWLPAAAGGAGSAGRLALHFLDVGQGDAVLLTTPHGRRVLIDAGPRSPGFDAGRSRILPALARAGARGLDVLYLSHAHLDHVGGAPAILEALPVGTVVEPAFPITDSVYTGLLAAVARTGTAWDAGRRGESLVLDSVQIDVLHPDTSWNAWGLDVNEGSLVLLVRYRGFRALLAGDAGLAAESELAGRVGRVDLLKVGHHGSRTSTGPRWLLELGPSVAVVSAGRGNRYGHPSRETLARLDSARAAVWRTDLDGTVSVVTDGAQVEVTARRRRASYDVISRGP
jgi:competence protein ComEC